MKKGRNASSAKGPTQRQFRVGEELRHALVRILERAHFRDPDLSGVPITVTEVRISPDLRNATAFITPLGGREIEKVVKALNRAAGYFRREIPHEVQLRAVPEIAFSADKSFDYSSKIDALLAQPQVARDLDQDAARDLGPDAGSDADADTGGKRG